MKSELFQRLQSLPPIVRVIIAQATRRRVAGGMTEAVFVAQMNRLAREELEPKGLSLLVRDLPGGRTRFLVKEMKGGTVCDMLDFAADGTIEVESSDQHVGA
jgi:hypothetical protein